MVTVPRAIVRTVIVPTVTARKATVPPATVRRLRVPSGRVAASVVEVALAVAAVEAALPS
jgi:hypothetical protein